MASEWTHKGYEISLSGAEFVAVVGGKQKRFPSLAAAKKGIDKIEDAKLTEEPIRLAVTLWLSPNSSYYAKSPEGAQARLYQGFIVGVQDAEAVFDPPIESHWKQGEILPDAEESRELIRQVEQQRAIERAAEAARRALLSGVDTVRVPHPGYGRFKAKQAELIAGLKASYSRAGVKR